MAKRRIKNNFSKWLKKSVPFFLIVFFVSFNISFFVYNSAGHAKKLASQQLGSLKEISHESGFDYVLGVPEMEDLKDKLEIYKMEKDGYPSRLTEINPKLKSKKWLYTKTSDRYILEYNH